jgi:hypothetical protein
VLEAWSDWLTQGDAMLDRSHGLLFLGDGTARRVAAASAVVRVAPTRADALLTLGPLFLLTPAWTVLTHQLSSTLAMVLTTVALAVLVHHARAAGWVDSGSARVLVLGVPALPMASALGVAWLREMRALRATL